MRCHAPVQLGVVHKQRGLGRGGEISHCAHGPGPLSGKEIRALRQLRRENMESRYVFITERGGPATTAGFLKTIARIGEAAKLPFPIHPHMLRHSTGYKLANDGHDTRALQHYMGHKNIMHTVRYTDMAPDRFKNFWKD